MSLGSTIRNFVFTGLALALPAFAQITLTGAIQFSTNATGAFSENQSWNTLGGDLCWDMWLALDPDGTSPLNGPSDAQASISIPLQAGTTYTYYTFGAPDLNIVSNGLNLFFDGNNSTPAISVFGATNSGLFLPNNSSGTRTLTGATVSGSGHGFYASGGVVVVLTGYDWNAPATPPGDVCQAFDFTPAGGNVADFSGFFTLQVFTAASLNSSLPSGSPGTKLTLTGSAFAPMETVDIYFGALGSSPLAVAAADSSGGFAITAREQQAPYGPRDLYAVGQSSGYLGATSISVTPGLAISPASGAPGGMASAQGRGFGDGEAVKVYWANPRQLLGTVTASHVGSFIGSSALTFTIPSNAPPGSNAVTAIGQTTKAVAIGKITVE